MATATQDRTDQFGIKISSLAQDTLLITLLGSWMIRDGVPPTAQVLRAIESRSSIRRIQFDSEHVTSWDTGLVTFLKKVSDVCARHHIEIDRQGLPQGAWRLLDLAQAVSERKGARRSDERRPLVERVGHASIALPVAGHEMLAFIGDLFRVLLKLARGKARFRRVDLALTIQQVGAEALPIVTLISVLVGMILAFVGMVQLQQFGGEIFVANLVGLAMAREMGAMMTGIMMAGRTGAAFAAQLGTMKVNQEIDALETLGLRPMEFLVLPRMLALMLMMPLLTVYADVLGILGGAIVGVSKQDVTATQYFEQTRSALALSDFAVGLFKSAVFGVLVAFAGCLRGLQCGNSSAAVGLATTSAVVTAIVLIIASTAVMNVITTVLGV